MLNPRLMQIRLDLDLNLRINVPSVVPFNSISQCRWSGISTQANDRQAWS
jgi:hypothetical protein